MSSDNCPTKELKSLKWDYSLPDFLKLKEYVDIMDDVERSVNKDQEIKLKVK